MKKIALLGLIALIMISCGNSGKPEADVIIVNGDTLGAVYETHVVRSCNPRTPISIHEEMNPAFTVILEDGSEFTSRRHYNVGDSIIYTIYQK